MVGHFEVDVVRGDGFFTGPAFVNDGGEFLGDVKAPLVFPAVIEPIDEFFGGILLQDIEVEFALTGEAGKGEVAAAGVADDGGEVVLAVEKVELGVEAMAQKEFDDEFAVADLLGEAAETVFVGVGGGTEGELLAEFFSELAAELNGRLVADALLCILEGKGGF